MSTLNSRTCIRCIMNDKVDPDIRFDDKGICNHCRRYDELINSRVIAGAAGLQALDELVKRIKQRGAGQDYDCLIGVSGGVDSTYVAYLVKEKGLRPLAVHFDNGWNSELAVQNIEKVLKRLQIDLITYVVDWNEFRDLQVAFLKASVPDGEIPTDHAINALLWKEADKRGIKYIISGMNFRTESISVHSWSYGHADWKYIKNVHSKYGTIKLKTYPHFNFLYLFYVNFIKRVRTVSILNYVDYDKERAMAFLESELEWVPYEGKHYESVYTKFFQSYILPVKFGIDKRYGHLSDLINSNQLSREDAKEIIAKSPFDASTVCDDISYAIKKLKLSEQEFNSIMDLPPQSFMNFGNNFELLQRIKIFVNFLRNKNLYPR